MGDLPKAPNLALASFLQIAAMELNVKEIPGKNHNPRILHYHKFTSLGATSDEVPWCSSAVNFVVVSAGFKGTNNAMARSWETWGKELLIPLPGCIVVLSRGDNPRYGHSFFFLNETSKMIRGISPNTGDKWTIASFPKNRLLGYRTVL